MTNDRREESEVLATRFYVNATDSFMSGWGLAPYRSFYCVACPNMSTAQEVESRMDKREEFKRVAISKSPRRGNSKCHTSISWYTDFTWGIK